MQKNADISKIKGVQAIKGIFSETKKGVYLRAKFEISSIILTSFRQGVILPPPPPLPQNEPLKKPPRLGLMGIYNHNLCSTFLN